VILFCRGDFILASDVYVSASIIEGLPFNILEALSVKRTVIASDIKGQKDIISDGVDGFLYPYGDMDAFVNTVCDVYNGKRTLTPEDIFASYEKYSFDTVFEKTLATIKESAQI
jgi:glycosyltransferase EpsD